MAFALAMATTVAFAAKAPKGPPTPNLLHCGCSIDAESGDVSLKYVAISVNANALKGHSKHTGGIETCHDTTGGEYQFVRDPGDCELIDRSNIIPECTDEAAGDFCGYQMPD